MTNVMTHAAGHRKGLPLSDEECLVDLELPVPEPGPYDLLVKVKAIALNPVDHHVRGRAHPGGDARVSGWDTAGTVVAVGEKTWTFRAGDEVYYAGATDRPGTNSEYQVVDERFVARKPVSIGFTEAAALPLSSLIAWEGLFGRLGLQRGAVEQARGALLVTAAADGVGSMVIQLAHALTSLPVIGTASRPEAVAFALRMGADHVVDHRRPLVPQVAAVAPHGLDHVFSTTGTRRNLAAYAEALNPFGQILAVDDVEELPIGLLKPKSISFQWDHLFARPPRSPDPTRQQYVLTQIAHLVDTGILTTPANRDLGVINAANLQEGHRLLESGDDVGKITLTGF
ncbi:zinc-binding alcohol dehydrogenase family protein [Streptomyces seoulensis]